MNFDISFSGPRLSARDLSNLEKKIGYSLPRDYVDFLLSTNGGVPDTDMSFWRHDELIGLQKFLALFSLEDDGKGIYSKWLDYREEALLPFAMDIQGNFVFFEELTGFRVVSFWEEGTVSNSVVIASDFSDFVSRLVPD